MTSLPSTQILLSTYNGARFLEPLLESLQRQTHRASIRVRDDGSADATPSILQRYARASSLSVCQGPHLGAAASFFELLRTSDADIEYFAFCDQDDVWLPEKLSRAIARFAGLHSDIPGLYCGRLELVDESLKPLALTVIPRRGPGFENALVENIAAGCTIVLNAAARRLLIENPPRMLIAHDWWAYLVVAAFGTVLYDDHPTVRYRQHRANAVGVDRYRYLKWLRRVRQFRKNRAEMAVLNQALEFRRLFGSRLDTPKALILERFMQRRRSMAAAVAYARRPEVFRQAFTDDMIMRTLIALRLM